MDYYMQGICKKGLSCPYSSSHTYILTNSFHHLIIHSCQILNKYDKVNDNYEDVIKVVQEAKQNKLNKHTKYQKPTAEKVKVKKTEEESKVES